MKRVRKVGISVSLLLAALGLVSLWILVHVWRYDRLILQEPRDAVLVIETIGMGLTVLFALACAVYFWKAEL